MPWPRDHRLLTVFGDAYSGAEQWQFGMRLDAPPDPPPSTTQINAAKTAVRDYWRQASGAAMFPASHRLLGIKIAPQMAAGGYGELDAIESLYSSPEPGILSSPAVPQQTLAITLQTSVTRGRGSKGRFYPPPQPSLTPVATDGRISTANADTVLTMTRTMIQAINASGVGVVSVGSALAVTLNPVVSLKCGRVIDTQRRRRSAISEEYVELPLA